MTSRLQIIRRCSNCDQRGHNRRNCSVLTIGNYCYFRENAELFQQPPLIRRTPVTYLRPTINIFLEGSVEQGSVEQTQKNIKLYYYHIEEEEQEQEGNQECAICLSDDYKTCQMAKLNCGHQFCNNCTDNLITSKKSCCALCREEITKVEVSSGESYGVLKENECLSTF